MRDFLVDASSTTIAFIIVIFSYVFVSARKFDMFWRFLLDRTILAINH